MAQSLEPGPPSSRDETRAEALATPLATPVEPRPGVNEPVTTPAEPMPDPVADVVEPVTVPVEATPAPVADVVEPVTTPVEPETGVYTPVAPEEPPAATPMVAVVEPLAPEVLPLGLEEPADVGPEHRRLSSRSAVPTHSTWFSVFTWIRNIGIIVLLFVAWQLWGTAIAQHRAQDQLKSQFDAALKTDHAPPKATSGSGPALIPAGTSFPSPADGSVVARLQIPSIGVDQYVVSGTSTDDLSRGPGHYVGTALPGQAGNVAIAGHRTTHGAPFNGLDRLVRGNRIVLTTTWGEHLTYVVSGTPVAVSPGDVSVLNYFGDNRITLTTCNPEFSSTQRLVAVGQLKTPVATPKPAKNVTYHVANSETASWDWSLLPAVGVEVCLLLLLGLSFRRFNFWFGRGKWLILVPIWGALLYLLFGTLTTFLPSSM